MKKIICIALFFSVLFTVTACGSGKEELAPEKEIESSMDNPVWPDVESGERKEPAAETEAVQKEQAQTEVQRTAFVQEDKEKEAAEVKLKVQVGDTIFTATLAENSSVDALKELMEEGPLTLNMSDYANMEKGADLGVTLPQNNEQMNTEAGDIILYQGRTFVIYYDTNSWSLTPIGKIDNVDAGELRETLGTGDVIVTLSLE